MQLDEITPEFVDIEFVESDVLGTICQSSEGAGVFDRERRVFIY
jgi:hypothetical protein